MLLGKSGGDFVDFISTVLPFEKHLPGHSFTGASTRLDLRLNKDLTPKEWSQPINKIDQAAYKHDIACMSKDKEVRRAADDLMIQELENIENPNFRERVERKIVLPILKSKRFLGLGISPSNLRFLLQDEN